MLNNYETYLEAIVDEVNGWVHEPEHPSNGITWLSEDETASVSVFCHPDDISIYVADERVTGMKHRRLIHREEYESADDVDRYLELEKQAVEDGIDYAVDWMSETAPDEWSHPGVSESIFDAPIGYELEKCYLENRTLEIYYKQTEFDEEQRPRDPGKLDDHSADNCEYLYVHIWRGSGKATVALSPRLRAHGPGDGRENWEVEPVVDTPDECGLEVALTMARQWAQEQTDGEVEADLSAGQADITQFSA